MDWYARLEQGRDVQASVKTIDAIGDALALSDVERAYAQILARARLKKTNLPGPSALVSAPVKQLLREMIATPAYVMNSRWDVIDWNPAATTLFGDPGKFNGRGRSCLWQHFLGEPFGRILSNRALVLPYVAALFRFTTAQAADASWRRTLIEELSRASREFAVLWDRQEVADWGEAEKVFDHPTLGPLTFTNISHQLSGMNGPSYRIVTYLPEPETRKKILSLLHSEVSESIPAQ